MKYNEIQMTLLELSLYHLSIPQLADKMILHRLENTPDEL